MKPKLNWPEVKGSADRLRHDMEWDYMLRRYQKIMEGDLPLEEKVFHVVTKAMTRFVSTWRVFAKRTLDIGIAVTGLIVFAPVIAIVALVIKIDSPGPVLYRQTRVGLNGRHFDIFKFRSMRVDAEVATGPVWCKDSDPRITRVGDFLRKTHLDEIPQFFNVLMGDMSVVGPRPERPHFVKELRKQIPQYEQRLFAKPGITGLAQVRQRYDESLQDVKNKVRYDVLYIKKMCPLLDIRVLALTALTVVLKTGR